MALKAKKPLPKGYPTELRTIGDHIRRKRLDQGLMQKELAELLGVSPDSISAWVKNHKEPQTYLMPRVIEFLGYTPYESPESFAAWIRMVRSSSGLSQRRFARLLGVDQTTVQSWEAERHKPTKDSLKKLGGFLT